MNDPNKPKLTPLERECLIERAAIMEFDGGMTREDAERAAWTDHHRQKTAWIIHDVRAMEASREKSA